MPGYFREIAVRVFAKEIRDSAVVYREEGDQYAPQYVMTPTGARINRVLIAGTLTENENIGTDSEYYRARISDPTGTFMVYAGQYQAEAMRFLSEVETPAFVAVVGKVNAFKADDGNILVSIRPEHIQKIDEKDRNLWVFETAQKTHERITEIETDSEKSAELLKHYHPDFAGYRKMMAEALETIQ
ncbi:hypothetical protein MsAg5_16390 [Methanosarcinaceae archaeon Ag5]|uniref:Uncharacterized protein n=1 Tax=Methanolapillus africanus TaxID=3028297 RepID=A0AAE4SDT2_9EURY|nr:hypothetical protein [Methanosarcinaceae archaeon Ag5]